MVTLTCGSPGCSYRLCRGGRHRPCPAWSVTAGGCSRTRESPSGRGRSPPSSAYASPPYHSPVLPSSCSPFPAQHKDNAKLFGLEYMVNFYLNTRN